MTKTKNNQKGFIPLVAALIIAVAIVIWLVFSRVHTSH